MEIVRQSGVEGLAGRDGTAVRFGLCLSGGGFRATFFHLGVIRAMRDLDLLKRVRTICSVSGGSVVAAHACVHWDAYSTRRLDDQTFFAATAALGALGMRDLRGRCVRRAILLGALPSFRIAAQLEAAYSELLGGRSLGDLPEDAPTLHVLATSLTSGSLVDFSRDKVTFCNRSTHGPETFAVSTLPLARAVAASAAFPPLVPPTPLRQRELHASMKEFPHAEYLTDGGIYDNLGVHRMGELTQEDDPGIVVISDASAAFDWQVGQRRWGPVSRNVRASSIVMSRVSELESWIATGPGTGSVVVSIGDLAANNDFPDGATYHPQHADIQRACRFVRTDLDEFSLEEIRALVRHGYESGVKRLHAYAPKLISSLITDPAPEHWPEAVQRIAPARTGHKLLGVLDLLAEAEDRRIKLERELRGGSISEAEITREREKDERAAKEAWERAATVRRLEESAARRLRVWSASDPISWATLVALVLIVTLVVALVRLG